MRRKKWLALLGALALALLLTVAVAPMYARADVGDFNDYDYGGGGGDSGGGWDSDSDSSGGGEWTGSPGQIVAVSLAGGFALFVVVSAFVQKRKNQAAGTGEARDHTHEIVPAILAIDPLFSNDKFIAWAKEVYFTLSYAWMARDWEKVRPFEKEELFRQHEQQIKQYIDNGRVNVLERININQAYLQKYVRDREYEYLTVFLQVRMVDYIKDEKTGQVLKGSPDADCHMKYLYTFMRRNGVKSDPASSNRSTTNCPNCGAATRITSAGRCEYCESVIVTGEFDWVLSNIDGVKPHTVIDDSGVILRDEQP